MVTRQIISIGNLLLDITNYRIVKQDSQKEARDAIIAEQGKKLGSLAKDILDVGTSPIDLPLVIDAEDGLGNFIVIEGNRRLVAVNLMLKPELAEGTPLHAAFRKLNKERADSIPKVLECVVAANRKEGLIWINRKHGSGLDGAGTEPWYAMAKARADVEQGVLRPDLDAVNFVMSQPNLPEKLRLFLKGSHFNLTTLKRLVEATDVQQAVGFAMQDGKLVSENDPERIKGIFTEFVTIIADGKHNADKFTERNVDTEEHRTIFLDKILPNHPKKKKAAAWVISGKPKGAKLKLKPLKVKSTPSTEDQPNLIPKKFKLELPPGKINDIFVELKELDVSKRRHAVSVLLRVFFELSLDDYITKHGVQLPKDKNGHVIDKFQVRLSHVIAHVKSASLLSEKELKPIQVARGDKDSFVSPETLNAYVHSPWMNPDPMNLKISWANIQLFIERLWASKI